MSEATRVQADLDQLRARVGEQATQANYDRHSQDSQLGALRFAVGIVHDRVEHVSQQVAKLDEKVDAGFAAVESRFAAHDEQLAAISQEQVALRHEQARMSDLLEQVLDRLPPA